MAVARPERQRQSQQRAGNARFSLRPVRLFAGCNCRMARPAPRSARPSLCFGFRLLAARDTPHVSVGRLCGDYIVGDAELVLDMFHVVVVCTQAHAAIFCL